VLAWTGPSSPTPSEGSLPPLDPDFDDDVFRDVGVDGEEDRDVEPDDVDRCTAPPVTESTTPPRVFVRPPVASPRGSAWAAPPSATKVKTVAPAVVASLLPLCINALPILRRHRQQLPCHET
jgi:hypothetical protein